MRRNPFSYSGIMTSYVCSAKCRHCMYCSTPSMEKAFISPAASMRIASALSNAGCRSVHIGGGEPFLNPESLFELIRALRQQGVFIDYIETNASWCVDAKRTAAVLREIKLLGANCVMVSVDPFHIEYVPLERPLMLIKALQDAGMDYFIWQEKYLSRLLKLPHDRRLSHGELRAALGDNYVADTARSYGLGINGRALNIAKALYPMKPAGEWLSSAPCDLLTGGHNHIDLYENVVPSGCPGIAIELDDFIQGDLPEEKYPVASRLVAGGLNSLYGYGKSLGFRPDDKGYATPCALCFSIRAYLHKIQPSQDIGPAPFYKAMEDEFISVCSPAP